MHERPTSCPAPLKQKRDILIGNSERRKKQRHYHTYQLELEEMEYLRFSKINFVCWLDYSLLDTPGKAVVNYTDCLLNKKTKIIK